MYVLVDKKQLEEKGLFSYAETLSDGRAILPFNALKSVQGLKNIDIVTADEVKALKELPSKEVEEISEYPVQESNPVIEEQAPVEDTDLEEDHEGIESQII